MSFFFLEVMHVIIIVIIIIQMITKEENKKKLCFISYRVGKIDYITIEGREKQSWAKREVKFGAGWKRVSQPDCCSGSYIAC